MENLGPRTCLIAEDEPIIASDLEETLRASGITSRWFPSTEQALWSLEQSIPDLAVIDVNLRDGSCTNLARALKRLGVPFIVHSGMAPGDGLPDLRDVPWLTKPAEPRAVLSALEVAGAR